jgi:predicted dienelactone hydrolase
MHRTLHATLAPLIVLAASGAAKAVPDDSGTLLKTDRGLTYRQWLPVDFARHRHDVPLILFSHGFGGCAQQSATLTQALADAGYAVLAPNHRDEGCSRFRGNMGQILGAGRMRPDQPFTDPKAWGPTSEISRRHDLEALLDYALTHAPYQNAVDPSRIAVMGHSLGGYAALGLAGAWPSWRDPRIKAVLALSPFAAPFLAAGTLGDIAVPVMYQTGTRDIGIEPALLRRGGYAATHDPKYLVVLRGAGHFAWTELNPAFQTTIANYAIAFFDKALSGKPAPLLKAKPGPQVARYLHAP